MAYFTKLKTSVFDKLEMKLFFFFNFWRTRVLFVGPLIPLFWTSGDVCPGFQSVYRLHTRNEVYISFILLWISLLQRQIFDLRINAFNLFGEYDIVSFVGSPKELLLVWEMQSTQCETVSLASPHIGPLMVTNSDIYYIDY